MSSSWSALNSLLAILILVQACAADDDPSGIVVDPNASPEIAIVGLQPGATVVHGTAGNADPGIARVVLWALTDRWYVQPLVADPWTRIDSDGTWSNWTHPWQRMVALLVDPAYVPQARRIDHPSLEPGVLAWDQYPPRRPDLPLQFAGYLWEVKAAESPFDPGPNYFCDSSQNVRVDEDGLHLRIVHEGARWTASEAHLTQSLGHGRYTFVIASRVDDLDRHTVVSPFLYESPGREIDIEFAGDALIPGEVNAQYVVQPYTRPGNIHRFTMPPAALSTHRLTWRSDSITFESWAGDGARPARDEDLIAHWTYTGPDNPPPGGERVRLNAWLFGGNAPVSGEGDGVVVRSFGFVPVAELSGER